MNYKDYYKNLSAIENRLFEEGYWKLGWVDWHTKYNAIVNPTMKWRNMMFVLNKKHGLPFTIKTIQTYMNNPSTKTNKKILDNKRYNGIDAARLYKSKKTANTESNPKGDS